MAINFGKDGFDNADSSFQGLGTLVNTYIITSIPGCTDATAFNYNPSANVDDGSCIPIVYGCTDPNADAGFDPTANTDNGSCLYNGCDNPLYAEYDATATPPANNNPGPPPGQYCLTLITYGCTIVTTSNISGNYYLDYYNGQTIAGQIPCDGSQPGSADDCVADASGNMQSGPNCCCVETVVGCTDPAMFNYNSSANFQAVAGSPLDCVAYAYGCTDPMANNFDATANTDDGSCDYTVPGCMDVSASNFDPLATVDDGSCIYPGCIDSQANNYDQTATVDDGSCVYVGCTNPSVSNYSSFLHPDGSTYYATIDDGSCCVDGCTDPNACNYDPLATCDDGSCIGLWGCTNATACNYNASATCDDGSCILPDGCTNPNSINYDPTALCDDGSCIPFIYGCTDPTACNYNPLANTDDGSCATPGCTDSTSCNYDATVPLIQACKGCCPDNPDMSYSSYFRDCNYECMPGSVEVNNNCEIAIAGCAEGGAYDWGNQINRNVNMLANVDDGSCVPCVYGCTFSSWQIQNFQSNVITNPNAQQYATSFNYDPNATCEDGNCKFTDQGVQVPCATSSSQTNSLSGGQGCTDPTALNYDLNVYPGCDDGTCLYEVPTQYWHEPCDCPNNEYYVELTAQLASGSPFPNLNATIQGPPNEWVGSSLYPTGFWSGEYTLRIRCSNITSGWDKTMYFTLGKQNIIGQ